MEIKRSYLKIEEIAEIVDKMLESDFSYNREVIKVSLVAKCCIDFDFKDMVGTDIYNFLARENMIEALETEIVNYYMIDKMVKEELSVENSLRAFLDSLDLHIESVTKRFPKSTEIKTLVNDLTSFFSKSIGDKNANV